MNSKSIFRSAIKIILPFLLGCLLLVFLYRNMDISEIWQLVKTGVDYKIILFSLVFGLAGNVIRGLRWGLLIRSIGEKFKMSNLINAVLGNYAVNLVLPRMGEIWRCGIITRYEKISFSKLLGTLFIDRISDTVMVGGIVLSIFIYNFDFFINFFQQNPNLVTGFQSLTHSVWIYLFLAIIIFSVWFVFKYLSNFTLVQKIKGILKDIWSGVKSVWLLESKGLFILQSFLIWTCYFFYFYITFYAFDFTRDLGISVGLIAFTMSSIGVAVPIQGGIGPWHFMVISTLVCFGVKENDAAAFALVVHTIQTAWFAICGLIGIIALPLTNRKQE